jgi:hypothetical protein
VRNQSKKTSGNQRRYNYCREGNGGQIHNMLIGFAPALWVLSHLNRQFNGKRPPS